jgi:hypothetical protein
VNDLSSFHKPSSSHFPLRIHSFVDIPVSIRGRALAP